MAPSAQAHHRSHSLLLLQKLLNLRDSASPLTLVCDTIEQGAGPLVREVISRAKFARSKVIFISLATVKRPQDADIFIKARGKSLKILADEINTHIALPSKGTASTLQKYLLIIDTLNPLTTPLQTHLLPAFLTSILPNPCTSLVAVYHTDIPSPSQTSPYTPTPLTLLYHLATTVFHVSSLAHAIDSHRAHLRSLPAPSFGLHESREGVLIGLAERQNGIVLDMEMRRRSGRAVAERFILTPSSDSKTGASIMLLADHPLFAPLQVDETSGKEGEEGETTFSLGLTEKQRRDREGIVLPYFDAQTEGGGGEGGRILYDMGREDDFDEEEDEI